MHLYSWSMRCCCQSILTGSANEEVKDPVAKDIMRPRSQSLVMSLKWSIVLNSVVADEQSVPVP